MSHSLKNWVLFFAVGTFWGATVPLTVVAVTTEAHPLTMVFWGEIIGLVLIISWMVWNKVKLPLSAFHIKLYIAIAVLGTIIPNSFGYWAAPHLTASEMAIIYSLIPMLIFALATLLRQEHFVLRRMIGVLVGMVAMVILVIPDLEESSGNVIWMLVIFAACWSYAAETTLVTAKMPEDIHPITMLCGMFSAALILLVPLMLVTGASFTFFQDFSFAEGALALSAVFHIFCYGGFLLLIRRTGPVFSSQASYVIALSGVLLGIAFQGDQLSVWTWAAFFIAMVGVYLVQPRKDKDS